jgi:hypothetical protein
MAVIGEELEDYVIKQINARQTLHGSGVGHTGTLRTDKQINLLNSNTSWIKLASGVSISGSNRLSEIDIPDAKIPNLMGMGLAKNNILFSGTSKLSSRHAFNSTTQKTEESIILNYNKEKDFYQEMITVHILMVLLDFLQCLEFTVPILKL